LTTKQNHIIEKELIEISFPGFEAARNWEDNHRQKIVEIIRVVIDRAFSESDEKEKSLVLDKLEVNLGEFTQENMAKLIPDRLYIELTKKLGHLFESSSVVSFNNFAMDWRNDNNEKISHRILREPQRQLECLLFFLDSGRLPWWAPDIKWDIEWLQQLNSSEWDILKEFFIVNDEEPVLRLITHVDDAFLDTLLNKISGNRLAIETWQWFFIVDENPE
jgi:hypothetical protein